MSFHFLSKILEKETSNADGIALVVNHEKFSYKSFLGASKILSYFLKKNTYVGDICIVLSEKTKFFYESVMACFLSGLIYTPINVDAPIDRNRKIIEAIHKSVILVGDIDESVLNNLIQYTDNKDIFITNSDLYHKMCIYNKRNNFYLIDTDKKNEIRFFNNAEIAYLLFTSGSTGVPKGVPISYNNVNHYLAAVTEIFSCNEGDHFSQFSDIGFDISIHEMLLCWSVGATLYVYDPRYFENAAFFIENNAITHCILIPSMMYKIAEQVQFFDCNLSSLKLTIACGEIFPVSYAEKWSKIAKNSLIANFYGPTEATVSCTCHIYDVNNDYSTLYALPIGYPFFGTEIELSDSGEIQILGNQISKGYWFSDKLNSERFQYDCKKNMLRYKTGDYAYKHSVFGFIFTGRFDDQWQVNGVRVEKSEIEFVLKNITGINNICVLPCMTKDNLIDFLCLFSTEKIDLDFYRKKLESLLPHAFIPKKIFLIDDIPRLTNGKINYRVLSDCIQSTFFWITQ